MLFVQPSRPKKRIVALSLAVLLASAAAGSALFVQRVFCVEAATAVAHKGYAGERIPGQERRFALAFDVQLEQPGGREPLPIQLTGDWVTTVSQVREGEYDAVCQIEKARISGGITRGPATELEALQHRLERSFWVTYRGDGAPVRAHFPRDMDPADRNLFQMIVTEIQLVRPGSRVPQWTALERDGAGMYLASYRWAAEGRVVKHKLKYVSADGAAGSESPSAVAVQVEQSELWFSLDTAGEVIALEGTERTRVGTPIGQGGWLAISTGIHLTAGRGTQVPLLARGLDRMPADLESGPIRTYMQDPKAAELQRDQRLLEGQTTESLLAAVRAKSIDPQLMARLAALFRRRPETIVAGSELVRTNAGAAVLPALAAAGTVEAVAALDRLVHDRTLTVAQRIEALDAFAVLRRPGREAIMIPRDLLDEKESVLRRAALMASGNLARAGRKEHPAEAASVDQALAARYRSAEDAGARVDILAALGNSAGSALIPDIEGALRDQHAEVRAAAARALRLFEDPAADRLLGAAITGDQEAYVRSAGIFAAGFRNLEPLVDPLLRAASSDPAEYVRAEAVALLRRHESASPRIKEALAALGR